MTKRSGPLGTRCRAGRFERRRSRAGAVLMPRPLGDGARPGKPRPRPAAEAASWPGPGRLNEVDLGLIWLVVEETIAGRAVPAGLDRGAARGVPGRLRRIGVSGPPVGQQPKRPG